METTSELLTKVIQDAVLKLCTQNVVFSKSLEIDGIICVSPGEEAKEIVVKMHRTIVKPNQAQQSPGLYSQEHETISDFGFNQTIRTPRQFQDPSHLRPNQHSTPQRQRIPMSRDNNINRTPVTAPPSSYGYPTQPSINSSMSSINPQIPSATQETPGGRVGDSDGFTIKEEPPSSPKGIKRSISEDTPQDTHDQSSDKQQKLDQTTGATEQNMDNVNIKQEEPITIELDDDEEEEEGGGYDGDSTAGASWMGDNTLDSSADNTINPNTDRPKPPKPPILQTAPTPTHVEEKTDDIGKDGSTDDEESTKRYRKKDLMWQSLFKPLPSSPEPRSSSAKLGKRLQLEVTEARSSPNNVDKCTHQPAVPPHLPNSFTTQDIRQPVVSVDTQPIQSLEQEALPQGITHAVPTLPVPSTSATRDSRYKCPSCPKEYRHKKNLMAHSRTAHDPAYDKGTLCPHCGQMFTHKSTLQRHINRHTHEVEYTCVRCKKKFYTESNLNQHQETCGLKVQKYKCSVCCKCFKAKRYLSDHMGSHDDPERYQCSFCPTSFGHRGSLHMHIMKKHAK